MSWLATIPLLLFAVVLAFGPGYAMGWALRVPARLRVFYAPLLTFALVAVSAIVLGKTGIPWSLISFVSVAAVLVAAAAGLMWLVGRRWPALASASWPGNDVPVAWPVVGAVLGGFLVLHMTEDMVYGPEAFSQSLDNSFHMNAIRWIQEHGDASSLTLGAVSAADQQPTFYPAGWHDFVSLIYSTTGTSIATATIVTVLLAAGILWPCSLVALSLSIPKLRRLQALAIPAIIGGFAAFPGLLLRWGVLFPNLLGYALLPTFVALMAHLVQALLRREFSVLLSLGLSALVGIAGLALVHPNAVVSAVVFALPMLLAGVVQVSRSHELAFRLLMVGPWYTDHFRLAALIVFPSAVLAGIGLGGFVEGLLTWIVRRVPRTARLNVATAGMGVAAVLVLVLAGLTSRVPSVQETTLAVSKEYRVTPSSVVVTQDELNVINEIPKIVPKSDTIVNNPWDGSPFIYALADRHLTSYHFEFQTSPKYAAIINDLKDAATNPEVCREVKQYRAYWYVHMENQLNFGPGAQKNYDALVEASATDLMTPVYSSGPIVLYRITACDNS